MFISYHAKAALTHAIAKKMINNFGIERCGDGELNMEGMSQGEREANRKIIESIFYHSIHSICSD